MKTLTTFLITSSLMTVSSIAIAQKTDTVSDAKTICHHQAVEKSGYDPQQQKSGNTVAKGAAIGAAGGAGVRAIQGKSLLKGAVIGAATGATAGGVKSNKDKKSAVTGETNYKTEYDNCLRNKGLVPEDIQ